MTILPASTLNIVFWGQLGPKTNMFLAYPCDVVDDTNAPIALKLLRHPAQVALPPRTRTRKEALLYDGPARPVKGKNKEKKTYNYNNDVLVWEDKVERWKTQIKLLILHNAVKKGGKRKTRRRRKKR